MFLKVLCAMSKAWKEKGTAGEHRSVAKQCKKGMTAFQFYCFDSVFALQQIIIEGVRADTALEFLDGITNTKCFCTLRKGSHWSSAESNVVAFEALGALKYP